MLDILLPGMNGYRVCSALREGGQWVPIIMLTAKDGEFDEAEALDTGADDFLSKPFSLVVLLARLRALFRRGTRPRPAVLSAGDLVLDPATHQCFRGDTEIELTPREFALLEFMLRSAGQALTKQDILEHVWDFAQRAPIPQPRSIRARGGVVTRFEISASIRSSGPSARAWAEMARSSSLTTGVAIWRDIAADGRTSGGVLQVSMTRR